MLESVNSAEGNLYIDLDALSISTHREPLSTILDDEIKTKSGVPAASGRATALR